MLEVHGRDSLALRKRRGAFFTPEAVARHIVDWAVRDGAGLVLEPSTGDADLLVSTIPHLRYQSVCTVKLARDASDLQTRTSTQSRLSWEGARIDAW